MAKKRKAGGKPFGQESETVPKVRTRYAANETFDDSEDDFYAGRDKVLLEERPDVKRRRRIEEENEFLQPSDEEVLGYESPDEDDLDAESDEDEDLDTPGVDFDIERSGRDDEDEEEGRLGDFGRSKQDYYNADAIETEQDALEEEQEARRIQQKQLESMTEADFGFDEGQWLDQEEDQSKSQRTITEKLPEPEISENMPSEERLKILKSRYPEFEPLAKDLVDLQAVHADLKLAAEAAQAYIKYRDSLTKKRELDAPSRNSSGVPIAVTKYRALSTYLGVTSMYFALLTSTSNSSTQLAMAPSDLRDHSIIKSLVQCRQLWESVKDIPIPVIEEMSETVADEAVGQAEVPELDQSATQPQRKRKRRSRAERTAIAAEKQAEVERKARLAATEASLADLDSLVASSRPKSSKTVQKTAIANDTSDFGDEVPLTAEEIAAKAQRRKSLRFYTSQIAQKANKRGTASRDAGGDTDIPHKERLRDRQARLNREAEKRGNAGADLDGASDDDRDLTNLERGAANPDEEYYQTITSGNKAKKEAKAALSAAHAEARRQNGEIVNVNQTIGPDGKRGITYEIAKNKGLTPHRKKDVRNPRVKKRKKYDEKLKKLGSSGQRQVYKGGEGRGGYGGEATGIKKSLVRSTKL